MRVRVLFLTLNTVACEGAERIERPESYKQWQVRSLKAGFKQLPIDEEILQRSIYWKKELYHNDFVVDKDSGWLLQGWKWRIIHAPSSWKTLKSSDTNQQYQRRSLPASQLYY
jgi:hypothetical protein